MRFQKLTLENFRGLKKLEVDFAGASCNVYGRNASGKTTIANAICWLLTGSAMTGEKDFSPKTAGSHNLHHRAELTIQKDDGSIVVLSKDYYEKWTKKKGAATAELTGHTTDFAIDGVPQKEKDYIKAVEALCGGSMDKVKEISILGYFSESIKSDDRRRVLLEVCGDVSDEEIMQDDRLQGLEKFLRVPGTENQQYSIDDYRAIALKQRSKLKKELDTLPERIDEQNNSLPEAVDEKALQTELEELQRLRSELSNTDKVAAKEAAIRGLRAGIEKEKVQFTQEQVKANLEAQKKIDGLMAKKNEYSEQNSNLSFEIMQKQQKVSQMTDKRQSLLNEWQEVASLKWRDEDNICPCCGQELPANQLETKKAAFMDNIKNRKEEIRKQGQTCSDALIQQLKAEMELQQGETDRLAKEIAILEKEKALIYGQMKEPAPFEHTERYKEAMERIHQLESESTDNMAVTREQLADVDKRIREVNEGLATKAMTEKIKARITELEEIQQAKASQLEQVEHGLYLCDEFIRIKVAMVTEKINSRFKTIRFQLFKEQVNGGIKECCEALIPSPDGTMVEYKAANTAAKVNAGLEIIGVLSEHYGMNMPIIMDQAESVIKPVNISQQLIRLIVADQPLEIEVIEALACITDTNRRSA